MTYTSEEIAVARQARDYIHKAICPEPRRTRDTSCPACPSGKGLVDAIRVLTERPRDVRAARVALHDAVCMSGCSPDDTEHADKTQSRTAASLRKFLATR
jgi:hypothetical protein